MDTLEGIQSQAEAELDWLHAIHRQELDAIKKEGMMALKGAITPKELIEIKEEYERKSKILESKQKGEYAELQKKYPEAFSQ